MNCPIQIWPTGNGHPCYSSIRAALIVEADQSAWRRAIRAFTTLFVLCFFMVLANLRAEPTQELRAGTAKIDITPEKPVTLSGYASRKDLSKGVHDPLSARVVAFESGGNRLVLVSVDLIGFYNDTAEPLRQTILETCQLRPSELFLAAIHTHSAPALALDPAKGHSNNVEYTMALQQRLAGVVREALDKMAPVEIGADSGSSPVGVNRRELVFDETGNPKIVLGRNPLAMTDREAQVLRIMRSGSDDLAAVLFNYSTHSTSLGPGNYIISGDVHGLAAQFIEKHLSRNVVALAFAGASGDIDPWYRVLPAFNTTNGWTPEPVLMGTMLGEEIAHVLDRIRDCRANGPVSSILKTLELPGKPRGEIQTTSSCPPTALNITVGRAGDIAFVGIGGEVFNEIGKQIKTASPFSHTFVITHCNGAAGYLPPARAYLEGGYEVQSSPFAPAAAERVVKEVTRMLHEL